MHFAPLRIAIPLAIVLALPGCATDIMRGYIGRSPAAVMARYGPPDATFDLPDGRRAFQWLEISESESAGSEEVRTRRHGHGEVTITQTTPPTRQTQRCFYTMYAHQQAGEWIFDDFERPTFGC